MECLPIKPITHIAGNACRLLWQHFFTVRMTTDAHRGNSECGAAVENYTRERDRDVDKKNQGAIVGLHLSRGGNTNEKQRPALRTPSACITVAFVVNASGSVAHETTGQQPSSARRRLQFRESFFAGDTGPPPTTKTRTMADPFGFFFEAVLVARRRRGKKRRVWFVIAVADGMSPHTATSTAWPYSSWGSNVWRFCCWLAVVVRREQNGAEQADKGRWLVFPLTILY